MLDYFFGSKARVKILKQFLLNPAERYYLRQLARDLRLQVNAVRRELQKMQESGLLISDKAEGNKTSDKKYYQANQAFLLYPEIRSLLLKAQILASENFVKALKQEGQPKLVLLTGSFTGYPQAQTDMLVVAKVKRPKFLELIKKLEQELGKEINFTLMDETEFNYRQEIVDVFLYGILESQQILLLNELGQSIWEKAARQKNNLTN
ncbi:MAG TPA: hypothetical protein PKI61_03465 [bacterium]|nr:hypothetical protein [bacterium]HPT29590.1 hypothetical protein [bacterium]